jgi:hypothetical protein
MGRIENSGTIIGSRPDRVYKKLPPGIRNLIASSGGRGFRLLMA